MRKIFFLLALAFCTNIVFAQELPCDDIVYPAGGAKGITSVSYWTKYNLNYYIHNYASHGLTSTQCQTAIQNAFNTWSQYTDFTFTRTYNLSQADIELSFEDIHHLNCDSFKTNTLAHATLGRYNRTPPSFIHFNDTKTFTVTLSGNNLEAVALHEIGHVLGLPHNSSPSAVMYGYNQNYLDLTGYDLHDFYSNYTFPWSITGHKLINQYQVYTINNLPSVYNEVTWSLINSYYNSNCMMLNPSHPEQCLIYRDQNQDMMCDTLTATIKKGGVNIIQKYHERIYAYDDFRGRYSSGNLSGEINYTHVFNVKTNTNTSVFSPNFYDATVSYSSSGATPTFWSFDSTNGSLIFNTSTPSVPVVINVTDGCGNSYTLYAFGTSQYKLNVSSGEGEITVSLVEDGDSDRGISVNLPWTVEVRNAATGRLMATRSSTSRSETISTVGWPKGIYVVKATIGDEELTEKVIVK
jgi:hypothetical protein